jgi:nicotinamidase-related amidase
MSLDAFSARKIEGQVRLDARSTAILIVDMLNEFCKPGGAMVLPGYELVNVLRGEMSLVGPRPLLPDYLPHYTAEQARRHAVKPGITG